MPGRDSLEFVVAMALGGILGMGATLLARKGASPKSMKSGKERQGSRRMGHGEGSPRFWRVLGRRMPGTDGVGRW